MPLQNEVAARLCNIIGNYDNMVEHTTGAQRSIDNDHAYIHQGIYFTAAFQLTLSSGATNKVTFQTNTEKEIHYRPLSITTSADKLTAKFHEGSSGNSGGSNITPVNRNRILSATHTTDIVVKSGVTVTTNGTQISQFYIPGATGVGGVRTGASLTPGINEWVLKQNTLYTIEFINGSSDSNILSIELQWYEE